VSAIVYSSSDRHFPKGLIAAPLVPDFAAQWPKSEGIIDANLNPSKHGLFRTGIMVIAEISLCRARAPLRSV
jgi:hypothetical protein